MKHIYSIAVLMLAWSCSSDQRAEDPPAEPVDQATEIVMKSIEASGGKTYNNMDLSFRFRDRDYGARHQDGMFEYVRVTTDSTGITRDVLNNDGYYRELNGDRVNLPDSMAAKYARSVNSVIYFILLPDGLNDPAVIREYLGTREIKGKTYHKIKVTFEKQGGGEDFEDVFVYWINTENYFVDYMAYLYYTDEGGLRFREAYNPREVGGIRFVDYINYKPVDSTNVERLDDVYSEGGMEVLSNIENESIRVDVME